MKKLKDIILESSSILKEQAFYRAKKLGDYSLIESTDLTENILLEDRLDFLKQKYSDKITHDEVNHYADHADPTPNKKHMGWIVNQHVRGNITPADSSRVHQTLSHFENPGIKKNLQNKDINSYKNIGELESAVQAHVGKLSGKEETRKAKVEGAETIYSDENSKCIKIKNKQAAIHYGKGTKWCTSALENNHHAMYAPDDDLYVHIFKDGRKFQSHPNSDSLMNEEDEKLTGAELSKYGPSIKKHLENHHAYDRLASATGLPFTDKHIEFLKKRHEDGFNDPDFMKTSHYTEAKINQDVLDSGYLRAYHLDSPHMTSSAITSIMNKYGTGVVDPTVLDHHKFTDEHITHYLDKEKFPHPYMYNNPNLSKKNFDRMYEMEKTGGVVNKNHLRRANHRHIDSDQVDEILDNHQRITSQESYVHGYVNVANRKDLKPHHIDKILKIPKISAAGNLLSYPTFVEKHPNLKDVVHGSGVGQEVRKSLKNLSLEHQKKIYEATKHLPDYSTHLDKISPDEIRSHAFKNASFLRDGRVTSEDLDKHLDSLGSDINDIRDVHDYVIKNPNLNSRHITKILDKNLNNDNPISNDLFYKKLVEHPKTTEEHKQKLFPTMMKNAYRYEDTISSPHFPLDKVDFTDLGKVNSKVRHIALTHSSIPLETKKRIVDHSPLRLSDMGDILKHPRTPKSLLLHMKNHPKFEDFAEKHEINILQKRLDIGPFDKE